MFKLIISLFADLADTASPFLSKRVKVLETVAQLRCCVIMFEIDCIDLVHEMFNIFFSAVRFRSTSSHFTSLCQLFYCILSLLSTRGTIIFAFVRFIKGLFKWTLFNV